ncbi:MAG TPA: amidohydrolase [Streptosporangiaceae bacterium]|jgi:amidohydrolase
MERIVSQIEALAPALVGLAHRVHAAAEVGFAEHESVAAVAGLLAGHGFAPSVGVYGLATALRAEAGDGGGPRVALLAEYDALPGIGHACGHNVICAAAVGAFLGVAAEAAELGGSVTLLGTPAEENGSGKETMARAGAFDGFDAVLMLHPASGATTAHVANLGLRSVEVAYHGVAAHASGAPSAGRNALDAVVAGYQGIAALRQHIGDTERVHGIITDGGQAANVVPAYAAARYLLRSPDERGLVALTERVQRVLDGAALLTGTTADIEWDRIPPCLPVRSNAALAARFAEHYGNRGHEVRPYGTSNGSTDLGNVSLRVPAIHPMVGIAPPGVALHTAEFAEYTASPSADAAVVDGAVALAGTARDVLADAALRAAAAAEFAASGGPVDVPALLA